jgi:chloramphenicol 3-O phosphotransferase
MSDWPQVILLNGSSSAGKSSLTMALQAELPEPYMRTGLDAFVFEGAPLQWLGTPEGIRFPQHSDGTTTVEVGDAAQLMIRGFHRSVRAMVEAGLRVIVDDVILDAGMLDDWAEVLRGVDACFVGVHCDLAELELREKARRDRAKGMVRWQFGLVHSFSGYDLTVDTTVTPTSACAAQLVEALPGRPRPSVLERRAGT